MKKTGKDIECKTCNKLVYFPEWRLKKSTGNSFCSHKCYSKTMIGGSRRGVPSKIKQCEVCGKDMKIAQCYLNLGKGKTCSKDCAKVSTSRTIIGTKNPKMSEFMKGRKHRYVKDRSKLTVRESRKSQTYNDWRKSVLNRDKWKCQMHNENCGGILEVHHILNFKEYPELRYDINNGITLCHSHHPRGREKEKRLESFFKKLVSVSRG